MALSKNNVNFSFWNHTSQFLGWLIVINFCVLLAGFGFSQRTYSGDWKINFAQSDFTNLKQEDVAPRNLKVIQTNDSIIIKKLFVHSKGKENSYSETFYYEGPPTERIASLTTRRLTTVKWSSEKDTLIIIAHSYVNDNGIKWEYNAVEKWSLSQNNQVLTVQRTVVIPDRTETYSAVYERR